LFSAEINRYADARIELRVCRLTIDDQERRKTANPGRARPGARGGQAAGTVQCPHGRGDMFIS
ncbi:MAG: hypothetical protein KDE03_05910, partial [Rhodobacteraceae bacterium]|nr:hypothetical protein [Paracoccaceae bacterium]